jgi:hypothetical protein
MFELQNPELPGELKNQLFLIVLALMLPIKKYRQKQLLQKLTVIWRALCSPSLCSVLFKFGYLEFYQTGAMPVYCTRGH